MANRYTKDFLEFWEKYPPRWSTSQERWIKQGKFVAMQEWKKLSEQDKRDALAKAKYAVKSKYTPDARKWLHNKLFDDIELSKVRMVNAG